MSICLKASGDAAITDLTVPYPVSYVPVASAVCKSVTLYAVQDFPGSWSAVEACLIKGKFQTQACVVNSPLLDR